MWAAGLQRPARAGRRRGRARASWWRRRSSPTASWASASSASSTTRARRRSAAGSPSSAPWTRPPRSRPRTGVDQLYVALPLEEHAKLLRLIKSVSNECVDIKVVPDLVQYATIKAALEDLDGIPIISLNEVPLRGWNSMVKRRHGHRRRLAAAAPAPSARVFPLIAAAHQAARAAGARSCCARSG